MQNERLKYWKEKIINSKFHIQTNTFNHLLRRKTIIINMFSLSFLQIIIHHLSSFGINLSVSGKRSINGKERKEDYLLLSCQRVGNLRLSDRSFFSEVREKVVSSKPGRMLVFKCLSSLLCI